MACWFSLTLYSTCRSNSKARVIDQTSRLKGDVVDGRIDGNVREYCQLETFSARCRHGDVVVMTTARFGRMRVGRCINASSNSAALEKVLQSDPNSLGCYADVLDYADRTCSGKTTCDIFVPNRDLLSTRPCFAQLTTYFEAAYQCVYGTVVIVLLLLHFA